MEDEPPFEISFDMESPSIQPSTTKGMCALQHIIYICFTFTQISLSVRAIDGLGFLIHLLALYFCDNELYFSAQERNELAAVGF